MSATAQPPAGPAANGTPGLLIHAAGPLDQEALLGVLRSASNARAALAPGTAIEVLVQGPGVRMLAKGSPVSEAINQAWKTDVRLLACGNSMLSAGLDGDDLAAGVASVPAAIAHLATRQWSNWAYARL